MRAIRRGLPALLPARGHDRVRRRQVPPAHRPPGPVRGHAGRRAARRRLAAAAAHPHAAADLEQLGVLQRLRRQHRDDGGLRGRRGADVQVRLAPQPPALGRPGRHGRVRAEPQHPVHAVHPHDRAADVRHHDGVGLRAAALDPDRRQRPVPPPVPALRRLLRAAVRPDPVRGLDAGRGPDRRGPVLLADQPEPGGTPGGDRVHHGERGRGRLGGDPLRVGRPWSSSRSPWPATCS